MFENFWYALILTALAGLATGCGGLIAVFGKPDSARFLSASLGFSAGVMIYVAFVELFTESLDIVQGIVGEFWGLIFVNLAFFGGMGLIALIDHLVPEFENPHEVPQELTQKKKSTLEKTASTKLIRMGLLSAIAIAIHNFPEGMATFIASLKNPELGLSIALAIGIHNIPEGIAIAVPIYFATASRSRALLYSILSGLAEPAGALLAAFVLSFYWNELIYGLLFAAVAGVMVFISLDQLLPNAERYGQHHHSVYGLVCGMMVMALSLIFI
ncbi:MAG: zinc transporter ZupT [Oligoflexus sp.]